MKPLQQRIIEAADHLAEITLEILGHANRGEQPPEKLMEERDRLVAELLSLNEERSNGESRNTP